MTHVNSNGHAENYERKELDRLSAIRVGEYSMQRKTELIVNLTFFKIHYSGAAGDRLTRSAAEFMGERRTISKEEDGDCARERTPRGDRMERRGTRADGHRTEDDERTPNT